MIKTRISKRGGKRPGAGRKRDLSKDLITGASTALRILADLKHEQQLLELYNTCGDTRLKTHIIMKLREWAYGKAVQPGEEKVGFDPTAPLKVIIEHIGAMYPVATKAS